MFMHAQSPSSTRTRAISAAFSELGAVDSATTKLLAMRGRVAFRWSPDREFRYCVAVLIVQKFGGTSVGTIARIKRVAKRCLETQRAGHDVAVVVSAMSGETNRLL